MHVSLWWHSLWWHSLWWHSLRWHSLRGARVLGRGCQPYSLRLLRGLSTVNNGVGGFKVAPSPRPVKSSARISSPCSAWCGCEREKIRPAGAKEAKNAVFRCAGRTFSRFCCGVGCAGRTFSRNRCRTGACWESFVPGLALGAVQSSPCGGSWWCERYKVLPAGGRGGASGTKFSLLGQNGLKWAFVGVLGEFCTGWAAGGGVLGEFCTGWAAGGGVLGEFCTGCVDVCSRVGDLPAAKG